MNQDEADACDVSQLKEEAIDVFSDSIECEKSQTSVVYQSSLPKLKFNLMQIRKIENSQKITVLKTVWVIPVKYRR